jgi:hypothetical protein
MPIEQYGFGVGNIFANRTDISNPTPVRLGTVQDVTIDLAFTLKELMGQNQAPVAVARAGIKLGGKIKMAKLNARAWNDVFFGQTLTTGALVVKVDEGGPAGTLIPTTPFQITAVNGATFVDDLGVFNAGTGAQFVRVTSGPTAGQYSVSAAGVYTFASADNVSAIKVVISYSYTQTTTGGRITALNQLMGSSPVFKLTLGNAFLGNASSMTLYQCIATKLSFGQKNEDFIIPEMEFSAFADSLGRWIDVDMDQV